MLEVKKGAEGISGIEMEAERLEGSYMEGGWSVEGGCSWDITSFRVCSLETGCPKIKCPGIVRFHNSQ